MKKIIFVGSMLLFISVIAVAVNLSNDYIVKKECLAASSTETMKELNRVCNNNDEAKLKDMLSSGRAFILQPNTKVELVKGGIATSTINVKSGIHSGKTMVISSELIKPAN